MTEKTFQQVAEELSSSLNTLLVEVVQEPLTAALAQFPVILERSDLTIEQKGEALRELQRALASPLIGALVGTAHAANMPLATLLFHIGDAWEQVRLDKIAALGLLGEHNEKPAG